MPKLYYASPRDLPLIEPAAGLKGRVVQADHATMVIYDLAPKTIVESHKHEMEQFGVVGGEPLHTIDSRDVAEANLVECHSVDHGFHENDFLRPLHRLPMENPVVRTGEVEVLSASCVPAIQAHDAEIGQSQRKYNASEK